MEIKWCTVWSRFGLLGNLVPKESNVQTRGAPTRFLCPPKIRFRLVRFPISENWGSFLPLPEIWAEKMRWILQLAQRHDAKNRACRPIRDWIPQLRYIAYPTLIFWGWKSAKILKWSVTQRRIVRFFPSLVQFEVNVYDRSGDGNHHFRDLETTANDVRKAEKT